MNLLSLPVDSIVVDPDRFREATGDMEGLATSILQHGLLEPIIIEYREDGLPHLVAGLRRLTAHQMNVIPDIFCIRRDDLDDLKRKEIELEENLMREQMTMPERIKALAQLDRIKRERDPNWTQSMTGIVAGKAAPRGQADVSQAIKLDKAFKLFPELMEAKSVNQALNWLDQKVKQVSRIVEVRDNKVDYTTIEPKIWLGDSTELIKQVPDDSFHAIITDPPFGVNYDKRTAGTQGSALNSYKDDEELYLKILAMAPEMYRTLKPGGWLVFFYGMSWHKEVQDSFRAAGFAVDELPVIWDRSDGRTFTNRPDHFFTRAYDVALHAYKGDAHIVQKGKPNVLRIPPVGAAEREFQVERPVELYAELIRRLTLKGERVADFFVGSGSCPAAAASLGRDFFGCELNPERRAGAIQKIAAHVPK